MAKPRRIAWDACTWIAAILQEKMPGKQGTIDDRAPACNNVIAQAERKQIEIATSGLSLTEVCKSSDVRSQDGDILAQYFRNEYILIVPVDRYVGTLGRQLMQASHAGLRPPDAVHLASAVIAEATEFHTFDIKLLKLDQKIRTRNGGLLKICRPPEPDFIPLF